ncbi:hypothetical protein BT63DRAFT_301707 [Microthyrium microscopicum]|uniref:Uncharacterized protein n=1 Tax=Microthyrium microscopicum TaxID=703497 RepID=A0A6A6UA86_9PEZI|nr:hypothetical protein BT63DRAFT_301707 [Microthyrium microscopicum]
MKTVPTIVATASIVGISGIGCVLGRPDDRTPVLPRKRKQSQSFDRHTTDLAVVPGVAAENHPGAGAVTGPSSSLRALASSGQPESSATSQGFWTGPSRPNPSSSAGQARQTVQAAQQPPLDQQRPHDDPGADMDVTVSPPVLSHMMTMTTSIHPSLRPSHAVLPTSHPRASPFPPSTASSSHKSRQSYDGRTASGKVRRLTLQVDDAAQQRREDHDRAASPGVATSEEAFVQPRPRTRGSTSRNSWMKRLSSAMSSRSASPAPSEGGHSPDLSFSNESKAFSHNSSITPMLGSRPSTAHPGPNKLVKRSSSQRLDDFSAPTPKRLTLRRPATSHQRTAALQYHAALRNSPDLSKPSEASPEDEIKWRHFFSVKVPQSTKGQKRHSSYDSQAIRRILPDSRYTPSLISAKTILTSSFDVDDISVQDDDLDYASRPASALGLENHILAPEMEQDIAYATNTNSKRNSQMLDSRESMDVGSSGRFSLSGLLRRRPSRNSAEKRPLKLIKRNSRRISSDPMGIRRINDEDSTNERPAKRRQSTNLGVSNNDMDAQQRAQQVEANANLTNPGITLTSTPITSTSRQSSPYLPSETNSPDLPQTNFNSGKTNHMLSNNQTSTQSPPLPHAHFRASNISATASEHTSTLVGSDIEASRGVNLVDDEDTDHSTLFDSLRTRGTRSTSGAHRGRIETIFDESPSPPSSNSPKLRDILPAGMLGHAELLRKDHHSVIDEEEMMATPVRTIRSDRADDGSPLAPRLRSRAVAPLHLSSPADMQKVLSLGTLEYDDQMEEDDDESRWSAFDEDSRLSTIDDWDGQSVAEPTLSSEANHPSSKRPSITSTNSSTTHRFLDGMTGRSDTRSKIFDFSEQPTEKPSGSHSPPRPRTVHGKKDTDRGSRTTGRRVPSGLHARSQSVPVVPALAGRKETLMTNKFGTWGVGSKGVSEDWDDDFDFEDESLKVDKSTGGAQDKRIDSGMSGMRIPQTIRESQINVVNNIGLVREFGLIIEELKVLRNRALKSGRLASPKPPVWVEIDAMIDLADQEVDDPLFPPQSSLPSSPANEVDPFEDNSELPVPPTWPKSTPDPRRSRSRRRSVLPNAENDVFSTPTSQAASSFVLNSSPPTSTPANRPRKDSEAMARSVIEALQKKKDTEAGLALHPVPANKKVPFDTNTLRHIVPYVHGLVRRVKLSMDDLTTSEGNSLPTTPQPNTEQNRLAQLFSNPPTTPQPHSRSRRPAVKTGKGKENEHDDEISKRMNDMNL